MRTKVCASDRIIFITVSAQRWNRQPIFSLDQSSGAQSTKNKGGFRKCRANSRKQPFNALIAVNPDIARMRTADFSYVYRNQHYA